MNILQDVIASPVVWFEISVTNLRTAKNFYHQLFGWEFSPFKSFDEGYWTIQTGENSLKGALKRADRLYAKTQGMLIYIRVDNLDKTLQKVRKLNGTVIQEKTMITSDEGDFAIIADPEGNRMGICSY